MGWRWFGGAGGGTMLTGTGPAADLARHYWWGRGWLRAPSDLHASGRGSALEGLGGCRTDVRAAGVKNPAATGGRNGRDAAHVHPSSRELVSLGGRPGQHGGLQHAR